MAQQHARLPRGLQTRLLLLYIIYRLHYWLFFSPGRSLNDNIIEYYYSANTHLHKCKPKENIWSPITISPRQKTDRVSRTPWTQFEQWFYLSYKIQNVAKCYIFAVITDLQYIGTSGTTVLIRPKLWILVGNSYIILKRGLFIAYSYWHIQPGWVNESSHESELMGLRQFSGKGNITF